MKLTIISDPSSNVSLLIISQTCDFASWDAYTVGYQRWSSCCGDNAQLQVPSSHGFNRLIEFEYLTLMIQGYCLPNTVI